MAESGIEPEQLRACVLEALTELPLETHLAALDALHRGELEIGLHDPEFVHVLLTDVCSVAIPRRDCTVAHGR